MLLIRRPVQENTGRWIGSILLCKNIAKLRNVPFPRPFGATGNDAQKLHAPAFMHFCGAMRMHEVLHAKRKMGHCEAALILAAVDFEQFILRVVLQIPPHRADLFAGGVAVFDVTYMNEHYSLTFQKMVL